MNIIGYFIIYLGLAILNGYIFNFFNNYFINAEIDSFEKYSLLETVFLGVFVAPIVETFFLQFLLFKLLSEYFKIKNNIICILTMSFIFSQIHWYHWLYVIMTFFSGLILNKFYVTFHSSHKNIFWITALLHSLYNLYGILFVQ